MSENPPVTLVIDSSSHLERFDESHSNWMTPAVAQALADHAWSIEELLTAAA
jgi:hypothetical protein